MTSKKWRSWNTMFRSARDDMRKFLKENFIKYELSSCSLGWHFEVLADEKETDMINDFLDDISIIEKR